MNLTLYPLVRNVWKNPLAGTPKDTEREQNYNRIFNPQCSCDSLQTTFNKSPTHLMEESTSRYSQGHRKKTELLIHNVFMIVYRERSINHQYLFNPVQFENKMARVKP